MPRFGRPIRITLPNDSEPIPDLAIVKPLGSRYLSQHPGPADVFWLIEFANTTLSKDLNRKKEVYAQAGIREYWVVDLKHQELVCFGDLQQGSYQQETHHKSGQVSPGAFPEVAIVVQRLMRV